MTKASPEKTRCAQSPSTAAYLDGELDAAEASNFEQHVKRCAVCAGMLAEQRRLLCLLDNAFSGAQKKTVTLPKNFARAITAHAQADMRGVRYGFECKRALALCAMLTVAAFTLLGTSIFDAAVAPAVAIVRALASVAWIIGHACADACVGATVILRAVGGGLIAEPNSFKFLQWVLFAGAVLLLRHLISSYHRRCRERAYTSE